MARIHRVVDDTGPGARIKLRFTDREDEPITEGPVTLRASGLFEGEMTYQGPGTIGGVEYADGVWSYDPVEGDLWKRGHFGLEARVGGITIPARRPPVLSVRARGAEPLAPA